MIELHTNCYLGGGCERFLYNNNTTARFAKFGCMLPQENFEKIVLFGAFWLYLGQIIIFFPIIFKNYHF